MPQSNTDDPRWTESGRLDALKSYRILDTEREDAFDDIVLLASRVCETPVAVIALIDADRQWFKAEVGLGLRETPLARSLCVEPLLNGVVVDDAQQHPDLADHPLVAGDPHLRFCAGVPLRTSKGAPLGALCVFDPTPRPQGLTDLQDLTLRTLASQVMSQLELRRALVEREEREETTRRALAAADYVGAWDWDIVADRVVADERFAAMYGVDPQLGRDGAPLAEFFRHIHPEDALRVQAEIASTMAGDGRFASEYRVQDSAGEVRWVLATGQVYFDRDGAPVRFPGVSVDVSVRRKKDEDLAAIATRLSESEAQFRVLADAMPQMVWATQPDGAHDYYNARWYEFTGVPVGSTDGEGWNDMFHPDDRVRAWERWRRSLETGEPYDIEYRLKHNSGVYRWTLGRALPIRGEDGEIIRWFGTCTDIDELKRLEQGRELVSQELSHRIKNIFAVVSALIALSARQYPEAKAFARALRTRINALARAHEFVRPHTETSQPTVGATTLRSFLGDLFQAYAGDDGEPRVILSGDDAVFDDQAATSVALLFHELATNAAKYGALTTADGRVELEMRQAEDRFVLTWRERGGPRIEGPPASTGFGSSLTNLSVEGQLGGRLSREWRPEGLRIVVDLPATALSRRRAAEKSRWEA